MLRPLAARARSFLAQPVLQQVRETRWVRPDAASQLALWHGYRSAVASGGRVPRIDEVGFKAWSQTDEDGILLFLLAVIGPTNRFSVELCAGDGIECNTANLIHNHGFHALLIDGDDANIAKARAHYAHSPDTYVHPPVTVQSWVTRDNVNGLLADHGFSGEIDVLSLDMDGVDYWIWEALTVVQPRIVVLEYQDILGPTRRVTVPYRDDFDGYAGPTEEHGGSPNFAGASLAAFVALGQRKGYRLVGTNRLGFNAFFVREDLGLDHLPTVTTEDCFTHPKVVSGMRERYPSIAGYPWHEV